MMTDMNVMSAIASSQDLESEFDNVAFGMSAFS